MLKRSPFWLFLLIIWISACATVPPATPTPSATSVPDATPTLPDSTTIIENAGQICFRAFDNSTKELRGVFSPTGCFSSSCTLPLEQRVDVKLDDSQFAIRFTTRFVLKDTTVRVPEPRTCTADCNGGGTIDFKISGVKGGNYSVWLGNRELGSLEIPPKFPSAEGICF